MLNRKTTNQLSFILTLSLFLSFPLQVQAGGDNSVQQNRAPIETSISQSPTLTQSDDAQQPISGWQQAKEFLQRHKTKLIAGGALTLAGLASLLFIHRHQEQAKKTKTVKKLEKKLREEAVDPEKQKKNEEDAKARAQKILDQIAEEENIIEVRIDDSPYPLPESLASQFEHLVPLTQHLPAEPFKIDEVSPYTFEILLDFAQLGNKYQRSLDIDKSLRFPAAYEKAKKLSNYDLLQVFDAAVTFPTKISDAIGVPAATIFHLRSRVSDTEIPIPVISQRISKVS